MLFSAARPRDEVASGADAAANRFRVNIDRYAIKLIGKDFASERPARFKPTVTARSVAG